MQNIWFIKIHRKIRDNPIFWKPNYLAVFMYIILDVEFDSCKKPLRGDLIDLKPWEWLFFQKEISDKMWISLWTVSNILKKLNSENIIEIKTNSKYTIIGLVNWELYQQQSENTSENELKTKWKRTETLKEDSKKTKNTKENNKLIEDRMEITPNPSIRYDLYKFILSLWDKLQEEVNDNFFETIETKLLAYAKIIWKDSLWAEIDNFILYHKAEKTVFKSTLLRLNTWFNKKITK